GELLAHVRGLAVRAADRFPVPDELLEVRLAFHAHVLVDRHRRESLGIDPDTRSYTSICPVSATELELSGGANDSNHRLGPSWLGGGCEARRARLRAGRRRGRPRPALRSRPGDPGSRSDRSRGPVDRAHEWSDAAVGARPARAALRAASAPVVHARAWTRSARRRVRGGH